MDSRNENDIKVSIIIPSYNSELYMEECLASAVNQSMKDIEIICVDAQSEDGTVKIISEYCEKDTRIKLISSMQKSYGYQIQLGIEKAQGKYIGIIESDDYMEQTGIEKMYQLAIKYDLDILKTEYCSFVDIKGIRYFLSENLVSKEYYDRIYTPKKNVYFFTRGEYVWNGLYKRSLFEMNQIEINHSPGAAFQDKGIYVKTMYYAQKVMWTNLSVYRYRRSNPGSSTYSFSAVRKVIEEYRFIFDFLREQENVIEIRTILFWKFFNYMNKSEWVSFRPNYINSVEENYLLIRELLMEVQKDGIRKFDINYIDWCNLDMFINEKDTFFYMLKKNADTFLRFYNDWLNKLKKQKNVVIFGAGKIGKMLILFLKTNNVPVKCICDNDIRLSGQKYGDVIICRPEEILSDKHNYYVISTQKTNFDIEEQLVMAAVGLERIERFRTIMNTAICISKIGI